MMKIQVFLNERQTVAHVVRATQWILNDDSVAHENSPCRIINEGNVFVSSTGLITFKRITEEEASKLADKLAERGFTVSLSGSEVKTDDN